MPQRSLVPTTQYLVVWNALAMELLLIDNTNTQTHTLNVTWLLFCCVDWWVTYHVGTYRSHLVISTTVYILAQSQANSYMHDIARLCKMCYEVFRSQACSGCAHASQPHSHSTLHALQTLQYLKSGRCQWTRYCKPVPKYFRTVIHTNTYPQGR